MAFGPDGKTLVIASSDGQVRLRDVASGHPRGQPVEPGSPIVAVALSPDGKTILTASRDKTARLWDAATGRPLGQPMVHSDGVRAVAFSPDGKTILTGGSDKMARLWDADSGRPIGQPFEQPGEVWCVAFSPDGKTIFTGNRGKTAQLWDAHTGRPIGQPLVHSTQIYSVAFSPDGKTILTGGFDKTARLWDAATGGPIGPPMEHADYVMGVAFSPDGRTILTGCSDGMARLWDAATSQPIGPPMPCAPEQDWLRVAFSADGRFVLTSDLRTARRWDAPAPLPEDPPRLAAWIEAAAGMELDERGAIRVLDRDAWLERRRRLEQLGGPPPPDPVPRLDPILFGLEPAARGDSWKERGQWDRAEAAYAAAIRARPLNRSVRDALARLDAGRGHLDRAAATLAEAIRQMPDDAELRRQMGLARLGSGDRAGWRVATAALLDRFGETINPRTANQVARSCVVGPEPATDPGVPLRLAEVAVQGADESFKAEALRVLGAALYRAGRDDEAIRRLEEAMPLRGGTSVPLDWPFLAMAHHRLGHRDEARRWLDRLGERQPSTDPAQFWDELELRLLRSEAEAVVFYDPVFPDDPFER
jgi:WD40 repeat protein